MDSSFSQLLKDLRTQKGWSMAQLGENAELSDAYISLLESNKRQPSHKAALKLSQILADSEDQVIQLMTAAGYPNLEPSQQSLVSEASFSDFTQQVLSQVRQGNYLVAEQLISEGLKKFQDTVQIQMLVAHLELARQHSHLAIIAMQAALVARESYPNSQVDFIDLYLNMGICHFMQASQLSQKNKAEQALESYQQAVEFFERVLGKEPEHVYCLDEYARCLYNLAHLEQESWKKVVSVYKKIISVRADLSEQVKKEVLCFATLATTRAGKPALAETLFAQILFTTFDAFTLHAYLCHCCYAYEQSKQQKWLNQAHKELAVFAETFPDQMERLKSDSELAVLF